jgi:hypothetical protein
VSEHQEHDAAAWPRRRAVGRRPRASRRAGLDALRASACLRICERMRFARRCPAGPPHGRGAARRAVPLLVVLAPVVLAIVVPVPGRRGACGRGALVLAKDS